MVKKIRKVLLWLVLAALALAAMGGVSYLVGTRLLVPSVGRAGGAAEGERVLYAAGKYLTNLRDDGGRRYISADITLELSSAATARELEEKKALLEHTIISVLRDKTYVELEGEGGMMELAGDLADRINGIVRTGRVERIFFTEFLIQ